MENIEENVAKTDEQNIKEDELAQASEENATGEEQTEQSQEPQAEGYKEKYYYLAAEMENLRKRLEREKVQTIKFGTENVLKDMIHVLDTFEFTLKAVRMVEDKQVQNIVVGLEMVNKQFLETIARHGLTRIETENKEFDPNFHEAIDQVEDNMKKNNQILREEKPGYMLNGRVLRAAQVVVVKNK